MQYLSSRAANLAKADIQKEARTCSFDPERSLSATLRSSLRAFARIGLQASGRSASHNSRCERIEAGQATVAAPGPHPDGVNTDHFDPRVTKPFRDDKAEEDLGVLRRQPHAAMGCRCAQPADGLAPVDGAP
jgi:hypothetical protein